jgi:predicted ATPase
MLTQIRVKNFKGFKEETAFPLRQLTLLTGINGRGKSTLLQSLLLMRQSLEHDDSTAQVVLNGSCVNLGSFNDIRNSNVSRNEPIIFRYYYNHKETVEDIGLLKVNGFAEYYFNENLEDNMVAQISSILFSDEVILDCDDVVNGNKFSSTTYRLETVYKKSENPNEFKKNRFDFNTVKQSNSQAEEEKESGSCSLLNLLPFAGSIKFNNERNCSVSLDSILLHKYKYLWFNKIHYISADRLGPQEFYFQSTLKKFPNVGAKGEFTTNLLYKKKDDLINEELCLGKDARTLATQTEEWLNEIFDGAKVEIPSSESNILELLFNTSASKERFRPANVGFGYHSVLPIVVSGLIAQEGEILIVENPEAHLHPRAQSRLARFLAKVSSCGVQVFIESHSDHILNALRIAVLDKIVNPEDLSILYFQQNSEQPVVQIPVQPNGGIEEWPEGFFDQMDKDFERLFGI